MPRRPIPAVSASRRAFATWLALACSALLVAAGPSFADEKDARGSVQIKTAENGQRVIFNESPVQKSRRQSFRLLSVPADSGLDTLISRHARAQGLSPRLVQAVVQVESGYNPRALSRKGAMGLMQLMPETARALGVRDAYDPDQNLAGGSRYLRMQLQRFGSLELALAAYNAGPTAVDRYGGIPPYKETRSYVTKVLGIFQDRPPEWLREHARTMAAQQVRQQNDAEAKAASQETMGSKVYVTRDENNRIVFTTTPPDGR